LQRGISAIAELLVKTRFYSLFRSSEESFRSIRSSSGGFRPTLCIGRFAREKILQLHRVEQYIDIIVIIIIIIISIREDGKKTEKSQYIGHTYSVSQKKRPKVFSA